MYMNFSIINEPNTLIITENGIFIDSQNFDIYICVQRNLMDHLLVSVLNFKDHNS